MLQTRGATLVVDPSGSTPYTTIQSAIDAAVPGQDDVFVRCGHYPGRILLKDGVSVRGERATCTTIDGQRQGGSVVRIPQLQASIELSGFTVRGGSFSPGAYGVEIRSPGAPVITRNIIEGNFASGIGVYPWSSGDGLVPVITQNVIRDNRECCAGGGILLAGQSDALVTSNLIIGNSADYGAGIYVAGKALIAHNTIVQNLTTGLGGGVWANGGSGRSPTLQDNVIADNRATGGGGVVSYLTQYIVFSGNDVFGNFPDNYWTWNDQDPTGQNGNVSVDPVFVDMRANFLGFQLRSSSPLLEAGVAGAQPPLDLAGLPRVLDGDADGVSASDIGARENDGPTRLAPLPQGDGFAWDPVGQGGRYDAFRGGLAVLQTTGVYTQDPDTVPGARHFCDLQAPALLDDEVPDPGQVLFYLVAARGAVPGTLGYTSAAVERARTMACTPP